MASCVRNIHAKNNQNLTIGFKVTVENVGGPSFFETQCICKIFNAGEGSDFDLPFHPLFCPFPSFRRPNPAASTKMTTS